MDVIALHQAGFSGAVAPLGTALTAEQLGELWRITPAPILCFDGDTAGRRAAARAADLALPLLSAERSLRLATLPDGEDPDTLVTRNGQGAFAAILDAGRPLSEALFDLHSRRCGRSDSRNSAPSLHEATGGSRRPHPRSRPVTRISAARCLIVSTPRAAAEDRRLARAVARYVPFRPIRPPPIEAGAHPHRHPAFGIQTCCRMLSHAFRSLDLPSDCVLIRDALSAWMDDAECA